MIIKVKLVFTHPWAPKVSEWTNKINGKRYIGSSVDLYRRFMLYYNLKYLIRASQFSFICKALLKHG